jgi:hypothetical protein
MTAAASSPVEIPYSSYSSSYFLFQEFMAMIEQMPKITDTIKRIRDALWIPFRSAGAEVASRGEELIFVCFDMVCVLYLF